jgi:hypothetical protein
MGADMLLSWVEVPSPCTKEAVEKAATLVAGSWDWDDLLGLCGEDYPVIDFGESWIEALPDEHYPEDSGDIEEVADRQVALEAGRKALREILMEAADEIWFSNRRDCCAMWIRCPCGCDVETQYVATGGMSWGDESEAARPMEILNHFDLASCVKSDLQHLADTAKEET